MVSGKKILLCVSGGIAVYKACILTSKLVQAGAEVKVIMTDSAMEFVSPLTFQALSRNDVFYDTFDEKNSKVIAHIDLADWADIVLVAPATANVIGKLANGIADDMLTTTLLATTAGVWIAPAMNVHMYDHPAVKKNIQTLFDFGYQFIEPSEGFLACGYVGKGRLEEPEKIVNLLNHYFEKNALGRPLNNVEILITAGPTREKIDPVRYFTNHSSGKMGYAIAEMAEKLGANVTLITGPTSLTPPEFVTTIQIESAQEMYDRVIELYPKSDVVIKSAAVADYRPINTYEQKLKKQNDDLHIKMERTTDILKELGKLKTHQLLVGFAAETNNVEEYAKKKLATKNLDLIVANNVTYEGAGFGTDTNIVTIYDRNQVSLELPLLTKQEVAKHLLEKVHVLLKGAR
ncbi:MULTISPECIES: bifunctional phosphopantothenoylcysteine decarboxylase/phosphopantothenate--cysteine ligase CoaBC [Metabacillus]|jgi:phosphopantothenoylcysteine decarboxylase / phosphopantothenate---cysteine ligase|uniref:Coenzyme A biosynthesis bifunctional protein CoaBC n=3 Tax=Metabacillus TaxID=2675233 RepID=A0A179SNW3_9BACI|nr:MULTISPECIES: bifunctional phosphopantothenoylcysteine decarboxylase/phosphopantothenate--cysteine ligase CoaBC [Metabacillus]OAS83385.1 phosphopantothenoylcysteine decarboxylase [Metabacillus litoralis]QNF29484.1 bifunctional phosphopantothenoylcysteine decarboxylase/phosphopantothenate--cysteine ligase CoaBC [Metabacillus sp. KUDC1714]